MSNLKIFGNHSPVVGVKEYYSINELFGDSVPKQNFLPEYQVASNDQVKWSVWIFERGSWRKTKENNKTGITVDYIFYQKSLAREAIKISVEVNGEKAIFDIKPLKASQAKIVHVDLLDVNLSKPTKPFAYGDCIVARVHCVGMDRFSLAVTLWEDDGDKTKQNTTNVRIQEKKGIVLNGKADVSFQLKPSFAWLANAKLAEGDTSEGEYHEYYVTAEFLERKSKRVPSLNTNVPNPDYKPEVVIKQAPAEKKGPSKKEEKGINKSENKVYDYHEAKVSIKPTTEFNPVWEKINSLMKVNTDNNWWKKKEDKDVCVCKDYDLIWGNKVSCEFRKKVVEICKDLWKDNYLEMANNLMAVFYWETGGTFKTDVPNQSKSGATGLIQFMPDKADEYFGKHTIEIVPNYFNTKNKDLHNLPRVEEFAKMTILRQLDYVKKYFEPQRNKKLKFVDFYLQVLFPVSSGKEEHVVFADEESKLDLSSENKKIKEKRVSKYAKNSGFDLDKNGKIFKSEIGKTVEKYKTEGLAHKKNYECENIKEPNTAFLGKCTDGEVVNGFIINDNVIKNKIDSCNNTSMSEEVKIIVLHRTAGGKASGTLNWMNTQGYGAHFVNDYDGTMYQAIGLDRKASHMGVNRKKHTIDNGWGNGNSIGIETCGLSLDKDGISTLKSKKTHDYWEEVTDEQAQSLACLLKFLLNYFNLSLDDIKIHEELCLKTELEGKLVYDAMLPYLK